MIGPDDSSTEDAAEIAAFVVEAADGAEHLIVRAAREAFDANLKAWLAGERGYYRPIGMFGTRSAAQAFAADALRVKGCSSATDHGD